MKKVFIHSGFHKTGTTSIQEYCYRNFDILKSNNIYYPKFNSRIWMNQSIPLCMIFTEDNGVKNHSVTDLYPNKNLRKEAERIEWLREEIVNSGCDNLLFSGEDIVVFSKNELLGFKNFLEDIGFQKFEVIFYVRNPVDYAISISQEFVRAGLSSFYPTLKRCLFDFGHEEQIKKFGSVFGDENVNVFGYDTVLKDKEGLIGHFFKILNVDIVLGEGGRVNKSMSLEKLILMSGLIKYFDRKLTLSVLKDIPNDGNKIELEAEYIDLILSKAKNYIEYFNSKGVNFIAPTKKTDVKFSFDVFEKNIYLLNDLIDGLDVLLLLGFVLSDVQLYSPRLAVKINDYLINSDFYKSNSVLPKKYFNNFHNEKYLNRYPDVRNAIERGEFDSGKHHYLKFGINEKRIFL